MLKKINRLKSKRDFDLLKKEGVMYHSPVFGLVVLRLKPEDQEIKQFGFIISKKIAKEAVTRNKIKRYLSQSVQADLKNISFGIKAIFLVRKEILNKDNVEIAKEVEKVLEKIR